MGDPSVGQEPQRLQDLETYRVFDTPPEPEFDHIAQLAAKLFKVPTALISFVGKDRQSFKARIGFGACETSRDVSFCVHALNRQDVLMVPDARKDPRFEHNPLVTSAPFIRFYAGAPLRARGGRGIGSLCIIDTQARPPLSDHEQTLLQSLARITMDLLERRRLGTIERASLRLAAAIPDAIVCTDKNGSISFWNAAAEKMFGLSHAEAIGKPVAIIAPPERRDAQKDLLTRALAGFEQAESGAIVERTGIRKDGTRFPIELSLAVWPDETGVQIGCIIRDVSDRNEARERVRFLTQFDRLTGLPNRVRFLESIDSALEENLGFTVFKIGFDNFKGINGSRGILAGDRILQEAARRLAAVGRGSDVVARLGSDEFGLLRIDDHDDASETCAHLLAVLAEPFEIEGTQCHLSASIGAVVRPTQSQFEHGDAVLKGALLALQRAKQEGGRRAELFRADLGREADERHRVNEELRGALIGRQFELFYQPQVRLSDGVIIGAEALLRWNHPDRGMLSPAVFMPILAKSSVALEVGQWILQEACAFAARLAEAGRPIRMGVNLFGVQLEDERFYDKVVAALDAARLPPSLLELEITETTVLSVDRRFIEPLRRLRALGVEVAFDDYGTGFASLSSLKRYPISRLKIDMEFVRDLMVGTGDAAIVKAIVALGKSLNLGVIAEGIEHPEQAKRLVELGCQDGQGYFFGKPMSAAEFRSAIDHASQNAA